jgi:uncharacterized Zn-binding protein involved in type VI secretion
MHVCPKASPNGVPHVGGQIMGGCKTVWINGKLAATAGDACICVGEPDTIVTGSCSVFIEDKPAARLGDLCAHGGKVTSGSHSVFIGGRRVKYQGQLASGGIEIYREPTKKEKEKAIKRAIKDCIALLERKLGLLEQEDPKTLEDFKKWFGRDDEEARGEILNRIKNALVVSKGLSEKSFIDETIEEKNEDLYAEVYHRDKAHKIYVNELFWKAEQTGVDSKVGVVIHELSHFKDVGRTKDYVYKSLCLDLAKSLPNDALFNASNFEYFVVI